MDADAARRLYGVRACSPGCAQAARDFDLEEELNSAAATGEAPDLDWWER
jgi:hypothetical protein